MLGCDRQPGRLVRRQIVASPEPVQKVVADVAPARVLNDLVLHLCLRADDGIVLVDTCPSAEVFTAFVQSEGLRALRAGHGLPEPDRVDDFPVHRAFVDGRQI
jgi:hypothetical protein